MKNEIAVVLVSGGMDSCVIAALASLDHLPAFLHINYGQKTERRELQAFHDVADFYHVEKRLVADIRHLKDIGGSSLTDDRITVSKADLDNREIPTSYVPFRNANILAIATSWAEVIGATAIYIGAMEEDSSGYPDCRREFFDAFERTIELGTKPDAHIQIATPIISMKKSDVVRRGAELGAPFHLTWSCYESEGEACGECDSCALRLRGFQQAGVEDPIRYGKKPRYG